MIFFTPAGARPDSPGGVELVVGDRIRAELRAGAAHLVHGLVFGLVEHVQRLHQVRQHRQALNFKPHIYLPVHQPL